MTYYDPTRWRVQQLITADVWHTRCINVPVAVVLNHLEKLTDEELTDQAADIAAEQARRGNGNGR